MKILKVEIKYGDDNGEKTFFTDNFGGTQSYINDYWKTTDKFSIILTNMKNGWTKNDINITVVLVTSFEECDKITEWVKDSFPKYVKIRIWGIGDFCEPSHPEWCKKIELYLYIKKLNDNMGSFNESGIKRVEKFYEILQKQLNYQEI